METRVLIVDDHPMLADSLRRLFDGLDDFTVVGTAQNAEQAIQQSLEGRPDVVVMDTHLPGASGPDAARAIRLSNPTAHVLFLSGDESDAAILDAVEAGAAGYLFKGAHADMIVDAVRRVASGEMLIPAAVLARLITTDRAAAVSQAERERAAGQFTQREREVLRLMGSGLDNSAIAARLFLEISTVRWHVRNILEKFQVHSQLGAVARAAELGMLDREDLTGH
jgi:two-component system response regulator DevR